MGGFRLKQGLGRECGGSVSEVVRLLGRFWWLWWWSFSGEGRSGELGAEWLWRRILGGIRGVFGSGRSTPKVEILGLRVYEQVVFLESKNLVLIPSPSL